MSTSLLMWEARAIRLGGVIRYRDKGEDPGLLFVHGILANGTLWREVVPTLSEDFRCIVPDLPLGGHVVPLDLDADLTPRGVARIVADLSEALELRNVTLVGNDTGGAICQVVISEHPERVGGRLGLARFHSAGQTRDPGPAYRGILGGGREPASCSPWQFARGRISRRLTLIATIWPVRYSSDDARHQISTEPCERQLRAFRRSRSCAHVDLRSSHRGWILFGQAGRYASFVSPYRACVRVCRGDVLRVQGAPEVGRLMGDHWRLAFRCAGWIFALMIPIGALLLYVYGVAHAEAFAYGVGIGLVSLLSTALTVTLLWGPNMAVGIMVGVFSFVGRCLLAAAALGVPAYLGLWPVLPMLGGFAGVYLVENIVLMPKALKISHSSIRREATRRSVERRTES